MEENFVAREDESQGVTGSQLLMHLLHSSRIGGILDPCTMRIYLKTMGFTPSCKRSDASDGQ